MTAITDDTVLRVAPTLTYTYRGSSAMLRAGGRILRYEGGATELLRRLLPLLDGRRLGEVIDGLGGDRFRPPTLKLCDRLIRDGLLIDGAGTGSPRASTELLERMLRGSGPAMADSAARTGVRVVGGVEEVRAIAQVVPEQWQVTRSTLDELLDLDDDHGDWTIVWLDDPNDGTLADWNEHAYHARLPWLPVSHFDGEVAVVGPYIRPRETPCFECYRRRRASRSSLGEEFLNLRPLGEPILTSRALNAVLGGLAVALLRDWQIRSNPYLPGAVRTVTFREGLQVGTEYVLRVPRCTACRPGTDVARPVLWSEDYPPRSRT